MDHSPSGSGGRKASPEQISRSDDATDEGSAGSLPFTFPSYDTISSTDGTADSVPPADASLIGTYAWDDSTCDATTCCCGVGDLVIAKTSDPTKLQVTSRVASQLRSNQTSGSDPCKGQTRMKGLFAITNNQTTEANFTMELPVYLSISASLVEKGSAVAFHTTNNKADADAAMCMSRAMRTSLAPPPTSTSASSSASMNHQQDHHLNTTTTTADTNATNTSSVTGTGMVKTTTSPQTTKSF